MLPTRKISPSIANPEFFFDPSRAVAEALGKEWLSEIGATKPHRVGLMGGLGFFLPYRHGNPVNLVRINYSGPNRIYLDFCKAVLPEDNLAAPEVEIIDRRTANHLHELRDIVGEFI